MLSFHALSLLVLLFAHLSSRTLAPPNAIGTGNQVAQAASFPVVQKHMDAHADADISLADSADHKSDVHSIAITGEVIEFARASTRYHMERYFRHRFEADAQLDAYADPYRAAVIAAAKSSSDTKASMQEDYVRDEVVFRLNRWNGSLQIVHRLEFFHSEKSVQISVDKDQAIAAISKGGATAVGGAANQKAI
ncbi:uncharacterized protein VTP21DRAFT_598 [Calcarisporiella thermophila]|uniref:uncharacterized protein n=1 Tax=Calcarisporiella thermophila TaxID=911321 RepID=UPI003743A880